MDKSELLTIEKLKLIMDTDNVRRGGESNITTEYLHSNLPRITPKQLAEKSKTSLSHTILQFFANILEPFLPSDNTKSDGRIASVVYLICLTTAGVVMNITAWLQKDVDVVGMTSDHIDGFLITCICPTLVWIAYIFCKQNDREKVDFIGLFPHGHRPLMAGAYVFGGGSAVVDILHISFYIQCSHNAWSLIFSLFKAIFILTQILFLRKFSHATFRQSQYNRLVLFHILGTNICMWLRALYAHALLMFKTHAVHSPWCGADDVSTSTIWHASEPYLYPFTMEYLLITGGILYTMWSELRDLEADPQDIYIYDEMQDGSENGRLIKLGDSALERSYLSRSYSHLSLYSRPSNQAMCQTYHDNSDMHDTSHKPSSDPGFLLGILLAIVLYISIACLWMDRNSHHALRFYCVFQITLHSLIIICLWLALKVLPTQQHSWYEYSSDDALLIVSFAGVLMYSGLSLTATITELHSYGVFAVYSLAKYCLVVVGSMLQVTAIVKALRFKPSPKRVECEIVRQCVLFLLMTNIALWGGESFFELAQVVNTPLQWKLFGEKTWKAVTIFAYPLCVFFRFHAAACLFEVWSIFKNST